MKKQWKRWNCRKVILTDIHTNKKYETKTITEACQIVKTTWQTLLNHDGSTLNGYRIRITGDSVKNKTRGIPLIAIENDGKRREYPSVYQFAESHYISARAVSRYIYGVHRGIMTEVVKDVWIKGERE